MRGHFLHSFDHFQERLPPFKIMEDQNTVFEILSSTCPTTAACTRSDNVTPYSGKLLNVDIIQQPKKDNNVNEMVDYYLFKVDNRGAMLRIPIEGLSLVIPPDAVSLDNPSDIDTMKIAIRHDMTSDFEARTGYIALSPTVTLDTNGLVFRKPVYLFLPSFAVPKLSKLPDTTLLCR